MKILIVDDNRDYADITADYLRLWMPLEIQVSFSGADAVAQAIAERPDVMLIDQHMPGLSGIDVASRIRHHYGPNAPYLMAMTGMPLDGAKLPEIDAVFDRAFAKPLDLGDLVATLSWLEGGAPDVNGQARAFDLAEVLTRVVRQALPIAVSRGILLSFDYQGPRIVVDNDPVDVHCCFHRLLMELMDMVATSYVLFTVDVQPGAAGHYRVTVNVAASGELKSDEQIQTALARMDLKRTDAVSTPRRRTWLAAGRCRNTDAQLDCSIDSQEGVLLKAQLDYAGTASEDLDPAQYEPQGQAWLVDSHPVCPTAGERRLQGLGWQVQRFSYCKAALAEFGPLELATNGALDTAPQMLIVMESPQLSPEELGQLRQAMPANSTCILAVLAGSAALGDPLLNPGFEVRTLPFSPLDLAELSGQSKLPGRSRNADAPVTTPAALGMEQRATVLLVDDNAVNRLVGQAMLESLGYKVAVAQDGLDAIDQCRRSLPQAVLMDVDMPVLRGIEATQRIKELQRLGRLPPFAVIAATADSTAEAQQACKLAGMDAFLSKPMSLEVLRRELQRFVDPAFRPGH